MGSVRGVHLASKAREDGQRFFGPGVPVIATGLLLKRTEVVIQPSDNLKVCQLCVGPLHIALLSLCTC